jgi:hypothetical protein
VGEEQARNSGMHMRSVAEDEDAEDAAGEDRESASGSHQFATPKHMAVSTRMAPLTPSEPVPAELIGLRLGWISKLEQKTEQVCHVMALPESPGPHAPIYIDAICNTECMSNMECSPNSYIYVSYEMNLYVKFSKT